MQAISLPLERALAASRGVLVTVYVHADLYIDVTYLRALAMAGTDVEN